MSPEAADQIISLRAAGNIKSIDDVRTAVGEAAFKLMSTYAGLTESTTFSIEAAGFKLGQAQGLSIRTIVEIQGDGKYRTLYYKSPAGPLQWREEFQKQLGGG
jgi:hypothetical protein